jgi:hypothetical protein
MTECFMGGTQYRDVLLAFRVFCILTHVPAHSLAADRRQVLVSGKAADPLRSPNVDPLRSPFFCPFSTRGDRPLWLPVVDARRSTATESDPFRLTEGEEGSSRDPRLVEDSDSVPADPNHETLIDLLPWLIKVNTVSTVCIDARQLHN